MVVMKRTSKTGCATLRLGRVYVNFVIGLTRSSGPGWRTFGVAALICFFFCSDSSAATTTMIIIHFQLNV